MTKILWQVFEIVINYYQAFVMVYFVHRFLSAKHKRITAVSCGICTLVMGSTITLLNFLSSFEGIASLIYWAILAAFAVAFYKDSIVKKLFASIVPLLLLFLLTSIILNLFSSLNNITIEELVVNQNSIRLLAVITIQVTYFLATIIALKLFSFAFEEFTFKDWFPVIAILVFSTILVSMQHTLSLYAVEKQRVYIDISYLLIFIINLLVFVVVHSMFKTKQRMNDMKILELKERYQKQYVDTAKQQYDSMRKIRHDIKNQLTTIYSLLAEQRTAEAIEYISENAEIMAKAEPIVNTKNNIFNAVVNSKLSIVTAMGMKSSCLSVESFDGIDDIDLCNLLSNALDNAITACQGLSDYSNSFVSIEISLEENIYTFLISNTIEKSVLQDNPNLQTTKNNSEEHGFGIQILRDISEKYGGRCVFYEIDNVFCCKIVLKKKDDDSE